MVKNLIIRSEPKDLSNKIIRNFYSWLDGLFVLGLIKESDDLASNVLASGLLMVHDTSRGGEDDVAELTGGKESDNPLLEVTELDVVAGGDDTGLVETIDAEDVSGEISRNSV